MNFNRKNLNIISVLMSVILFIFVNSIVSQWQGSDEKHNSNVTIQTSATSSRSYEIEDIVPNQYKSVNKWRIEIPAIRLDAPILEGTTTEVLRKAVGHFTDTETWDGNICLAAHNRGNKYSYFQEIKKLKPGDYIKYSSENGTKTYQVILNNIIKETDFSYIEKTEDNRITLITCVQNMPEYRQCVQAKEV